MREMDRPRKVFLQRRFLEAAPARGSPFRFVLLKAALSSRSSKYPKRAAAR